MSVVPTRRLALVVLALGVVLAVAPVPLPSVWAVAGILAAVAVLLALRREGGPTVSFGNVPPNLRKLASLYGVEAALFGGPT